MLIRDRIVDFRRVKATELRPSPHNWRTHPKGQQEALRGVLAEIGYADALLAREVNGHLELIDGHLRAETTPEQEVPVLVLDLDEAEARKLLLTLDPLAAMAEANQDALGRLLHDIETGNDGVQAMLDGLAAEHGIDLFEPGGEEPAPEAQIDRAEELQKKWQIEPGQLWVIPGKAGEHRLLCGDSAEREDVQRLMGGQSARVMFTDPPYGVAYQDDMDMPEAVARHRRTDGAVIANDKQTQEELQEFLVAVFATLPLVAGGAFYICAPAGDRYISFLLALRESGLRMRQGLCWRKQQMVFGRQDYHYQHELIIYGWTGGAGHYFTGDRTQTSVWEVDRPNKSREHPTMKPVELPRRAVRNSSEVGEAVFDPFLGSGTTMVAAEQLGRICYGIEIEPKYVAVALERLADMGLKPRLET